MPRRSAPLAMIASLVIILSSVIVSAAARPTIALAAASIASCAPDSGSATIGGTVTGSGSVPLSGVIVTAYTSYGNRGGYAYTNASGVYQITGLIGASYILKFEPNTGGYAAEWSGSVPTAQAATPIAVAEGGAVNGADAQLEIGARFSGTVTGAGSGPLQSLRVSVYDSSGQSVAGAYTDAVGGYTTSPGLPTGSYRIGFTGQSGFLDSYYAGKASLEAADPVAVVSPNIRSGTDATLARGGEISGNVTSAATGLPLSGISVSAYGQNGSEYDYTDASGDYTITGLASGSYAIEARPSSETVNLIGTSQTATVAAPGSTSGIDFTLTPGGTLSGRVTDEGGTPLNSITVYIGNEDGSYQNYVYTNTSGQYSATALPSGQYRVLFRPSNYVPEAYNNQPDFGQANPITVTAPNTVTGIDAVLASGSSIKGKVTDATTGLPIKQVFIEILDADGSRIETASTQADGTYQTSPTLPTGSYKVRFNADERFASCAYVTEYYNDKSSVATADLVNVAAPNPAINIDAALTRGSIMFGKVNDATTGVPITSGQVTIFDAAGKFVMFGRLTFLGGWHTDTALPSGSYRVLFSDYSGGYVDEYYNDKFTLATANPVVLNVPTDVTGISAALEQGAAISGRVTAGDTGAPFTEGSVIVYDTSGEQVGYANIEDDGSYRVSNGLASGSYRVGVIPYSAEGESLGSAVTTAKSIALETTPFDYSPTFYRGTVSLNAATALSLAAPNTTSSIDIAMLRGTLIPLAKR